MDKPEPTRELPENYKEIDHLDLNENRGLAMILNLVGVGLLFGVGWVLLQSLMVLRPEYLSTENILVITGMREFWRSVLLLVVSLGLMVILNEGLRGLMYWIVTGQRPQLGFRGFYIFADAHEWYLSLKTHHFIRLMPLLVITGLGLVAIWIVPLNFVPGVMVLVSLNFAGATGDLFMAYWLLRQPKDALVMDYGDSVFVYHRQDNE